MTNKNCAVPFHVHWCCWSWVSLKVQIFFKDVFLCRNEENPKGSMEDFGDLETRLVWAGLLLVVSRSRQYPKSMSRRRAAVGVRESITSPSPGPGFR